MKKLFAPLKLSAWLGVFILSGAVVRATDFTVTASGTSAYVIGGVNNPGLTLQRGKTYTFAINSGGAHPFWIKTIQGSGSGNGYNAGVATNGLTSGTLTLVLPTNAPNTLFYNCGNHSPMTGTISIINPPTPPAFALGGLTVSNRVVLRHAGTNTFTYTPEFTTNLITTNWFALTVQSNRFLNGTNEIFCGLPSGSNVFFRVRAQ
jgi:hypothetical protein